MSNDCSGVLKVVAKNKNTLERIKNILNYEDNEYCLYRCKYAEPIGEAFEDNGFWVQDFNVCGAWSCDNFFHYGNNEDKKLVVDYEKMEDGMSDFNKPIYGTAHFTDLCHLTEELDFGCELFASEGGMGFCSHHLVTHDGTILWDEMGDYIVHYSEDGECEEEFDIEGFMEFCLTNEIYG